MTDGSCSISGTASYSEAITYLEANALYKRPPMFPGDHAKQKSRVTPRFLPNAPSQIHTRVLALKGLRPGPLDDG